MTAPPNDLVDVTNEQGMPTGLLVSRAQAHKDQTLHAVAGMMLQDEQGQYVLQVRKTGYYDASVGGHVDIGETPLQAALREAREELGLDLEESSLELVTAGTVVKDIYPELGIYARHVIFFWKGKLPNGWKFTANDDVSTVIYADKAEIRRLYKQEPHKWTYGMLKGLVLLGIFSSSDIDWPRS